MSIRLAHGSVTDAGRSLKNPDLLWCAANASPIVHALPATVNITTSATANTKGAWREIISSASNTSDTGLLILASPLSTFTGDNACLVEIGVGASGSETPIITDIAFAGHQANASCQTRAVPIFIPSGTRVAFRAQTAASGAQTVYLIAAFAKTTGMNRLPATADSLGVNSSTSHATALTGTANVTYTEIVASTSKAYQSLLLNISSASKVGINANFRATLAVGPAGKEVDLCTVDARQDSGGTLSWSNTWFTTNGLPAGGYIPAGSRLSVKHNIASNPGYLEASVIGVPYG